MNDLKTLRLTALPLDDDTLERFVRYQSVLRDALATAGHKDWAGTYAFAHAKALNASGLDTVVHQRVRATVADFCGRRSSLLIAKKRVAQLERSSKPSEVALAKKAANEIKHLDDLSDLEARYGSSSVKALLKLENRLVELHRALAQLEGQGHVHVAPMALRN